MLRSGREPVNDGGVSVTPIVAEPALRHVLSRFSYGVTPALVADAREHGGSAQWFEAQLAPESVPDSEATAVRSWFGYLDAPPDQLVAATASGSSSPYEATADLARWTILRRTYSRRQLFETMVEFWSNLLHIPLLDASAWPFRQGYDALIRQHALGRFDEMLPATTLHPAMGLYLDNALSTKEAINENLGRELLELHTVGVGTGYTEEEVLDSARILSGWRVDRMDSFASYHSAAHHWTGPVSVLDFREANASADGRGITARYLSYLAHHPRTARRIATRLCVRFVADQPSEAIVDVVADAYLSSGTDIKATLRALHSHPDFTGSASGKIRTPAEDAIACYRALGARAWRPKTAADFGRAVTSQLQLLGVMPFGWNSPAGFPDVGAAWSSVGRMLGSLYLHQALANRWKEPYGVVYPPLADQLPVLPASLDVIVDHVSRQVLQLPATPQLQRAVLQVVDMPAGQEVRTAAEFGESRMTQLLATMLNSPAHMRR